MIYITKIISPPPPPKLSMCIYIHLFASFHKIISSPLSCCNLWMSILLHYYSKCAKSRARLR
jgi:hypothetical protein